MAIHDERLWEHLEYRAEVEDENLPKARDAERVTLRKFCNEAHPLSQFLIRNRAKLEKSVPGLFWEIMRSLAADNEDKMISQIHECLRLIEALPTSELKVPEEAFLKKQTFCNARILKRARWADAHLARSCIAGRIALCRPSAEANSRGQCAGSLTGCAYCSGEPSYTVKTAMYCTL